jgi:hypothetical protein
MVSPLTREVENYAEEISNTLTDKQIIHLSHIFSGNIKELGNYYGDNPIGTTTADEHAVKLARNHQDAVEDFLHRDKNEWTSSKRTRRLLDDVLMDAGVTFDELDKYDLSYTEYLLSIYHFHYSPEKETVQNYDLLDAKTLLFHDNPGRTFYHTEPLPLKESYIERKCSELSRRLSASGRNFHAQPLYIEENEAFVTLYWERNRNPEMIFSERLPRDHPNYGTSGVTHRAAYPVKTISLKIKNTDGEATILFSKSIQGWTTKLKRFFDYVFKLDDPFDTLEKKRDSGVDQVLSAARQAATQSEDDEDNEEDSETVFEAASRELNELREASVEKTREEKGDDAAEELNNRYETIEPSGLIVENVRDTLTSEFSVKSDSTLEEWMDRNPGARDIIESEVANAGEGSLALRFRAHLTSEDEFDEFVMRDGYWETESGRRVPEQTRELLNQLLSGTDE